MYFQSEHPLPLEKSISRKILNFRQTGVGHQSVSSIWIARAIGVTMACLTSGPAFGTSWMNSSRKRLIFLGTAHLLIAGCFFILPIVGKLCCLFFRQFSTKRKYDFWINVLIL